MATRRLLRAGAGASAAVQRRKLSKVSNSTSWGRMAAKVLDDAEDKYVEKAKERVNVDPMKTALQVQDEVQEEMAAALGRSGERLEAALKHMREKHGEFLKRAEKFRGGKGKDGEIERWELLESAREFNAARETAEERRVELIVHRQAVGFVFKNQEYVVKMYPIPETVTKRNFRDQFFDVEEFERR